MPKLEDLTGKKFNHLKVIERDLTAKRTKWICQCDCGRIKSIDACHLKSGATTSCGCEHKKIVHSQKSTHGKSKTPLYYRWKALKQRCENPNDRSYPRYGGRGITVCDEWQTFENFFKWSIENGYSQGLTLDRKENDKGYNPENCRWVDSKTQNRNKSNNRWVTLENKKVLLKDVAKALNLHAATLYSRIHKKGLDIDKLNVKDFTTENEYKVIVSQVNEIA